MLHSDARVRVKLPADQSAPMGRRECFLVSTDAMAFSALLKPSALV